MAKSRATAAREILFLDLADFYRTALTEETIGPYLRATEEFPLDAVRAACGEFMGARVARNNAFMPNAVEVVEQVRRFVRPASGGLPGDVIAVPIGAAYPPGYVSIGPREVDFGHGAVRMDHLYPRQKAVVLRMRGRTRDGRNMATMSAAELAAETAAVLRLPQKDRAKMLGAG